MTTVQVRAEEQQAVEVKRKRIASRQRACQLGTQRTANDMRRNATMLLHCAAITALTIDALFRNLEAIAGPAAK
jgi:hypothetical protein